MSRGDNVQRIFGRDRPILGKIEAVTGPKPEPGNFATVDFHQFWPRNVIRCPVAESGKTFWKIFTLAVNCPAKSEIENRSNRHLTQSRLQVTGCTAERYCLLHVVVQGPGSFRGRVNFLYDARLRSYGASKLPNFRTLAYFPHTKPIKRTSR